MKENWVGRHDGMTQIPEVAVCWMKVYLLMRSATTTFAFNSN
jgi:hypothetical protein